MSQEKREMASLDHVAQDTDTHRKHLRARLAETQAALLTPLLGLGAARLASPSLPGHRTPLLMLLEHAEADNLATLALEGLLGDRETRTVPLPSGAGPDTHDVIQAFLASRRLLLDSLARLSDDDLEHSLPGSETPCRIMERRYVESNLQVAEIVRWQAGAATTPGEAPRLLQLAALRAARKELLTTIALIPEDARPDYTLPDGQTLGTSLAVLADGDRALLAGHVINRHSLAAPIQPDAAWPTIWRDLHAVRQRVLASIEASQEGDSEQPGGFSEHVRERVEADRSLAAGLRDSRARRAGKHY